ncbi:MAG: serine protease [Proteobacteria bacterium]|nr:serine protease [Pseudomonadota bacterium]
MEHPPVKATTLLPLPHKPAMPQDGDRPQLIYVIGHPRGGELAVSMYDNDLAGYAPPYVRYRSPTEGGSSGLPIFNRQLGLFAVHHRALDAEQVNEGVLFNPIAAALANLNQAQFMKT